MTNNISLTVNTNGPLNPSIGFPVTITNNPLVNASVSMFETNSTGYTLKIWGDVDKTYNTNIQSQQTAIANPASAPTAVASGTGGTVPTGTYYIKVTVSDGIGETMASPESTGVSITLGQNLVVTTPALPSGTNLFYNVYISSSTGTETLQGKATGTSYTQSAPLVAGVSVPLSNTLTASSYIPYVTSVPIKLSSGDGTKTIHMVINDSTNKDSIAVSKTITFQQTPPVVTTGTPSTTTITEGGTEVTTFAFSSNVAFQKYLVGIVPSTASTYSSATTIGTIHGSSNTSGVSSTGFPANTNINVSLDAYDIHVAANGGGTTIVKVFVQDMAGNWSV